MPAAEWYQQVLSLESAAVLKRGTAVTLNSSRQVIQCNASNRPLGVLRDDVDVIGDTAAVVIDGVGLVRVDGATALMQLLGSASDGDLTPLTPSEGSTALVLAIALEAATADQDLIMARIVPATGYALVAYTP